FPVGVPTGARYEILDGGAAIAVSVDPAWLAGLSSDAFPVRLDPTLNLTWDDFPVQYISVSDAGGYFQSPDGMFVGRVNGVNWRGTFHFNYEPLLNHDPRYVIGETLLSVDRHHSQTNV